MSATEQDPALVALAREMEGIGRRVGQLEELIEHLATDITTLATRLAGPDLDDDTVRMRSWLLAQDSHRATADLRDLCQWLAQVYLRYPDAALPSCWLWHPSAVEELWWLRRAHFEAYHPTRGGWPAVGDWHDRLRPGVTRRLRTAYAACELSEHIRGGTQHRPAPTAPLSDLAALAAAHWTTNPHQSLIPTDEQIREAETHDATHHSNGTFMNHSA